MTMSPRQIASFQQEQVIEGSPPGSQPPDTPIGPPPVDLTTSGWPSELKIGARFPTFDRVTIVEPPVNPTDAITREFLDLALAGIGGEGEGVPDAPVDGFAYGQQDADWVKVLPLAGGQMTGPIVLDGDTTTSTKSLTTALAPLGGGTAMLIQPADATTGNGGIVKIVGGDASSAGRFAGSIQIFGGSASGEAAGGQVSLNGGFGSATGGGGGVSISGGGKSGGGDYGLIRLFNLPAVAQTDADAIWNNAGVLNIGPGGSGGGGATGDFLPLTGGNMTGPIIFPTLPSGLNNVALQGLSAAVGSGEDGAHIAMAAGVGDGETGSGGQLGLYAGNGNYGGTLFLNAGSGVGTGIGGSVSMRGGNSEVLTGGGVTISGGISNATTGLGGGGPISINGGSGLRGGDVSLYGGAATGFVGGSFSVTSGSGPQGGPITMLVGPSMGVDMSGAPILIKAGDASDVSAGYGGNFELYAGNAAGTNGGGNLMLHAGSGASGGAVRLNGANANAAETIKGNGGGVELNGGSGATAIGYGGDIRLNGGDSPAQNGGDVLLTAGRAIGTTGKGGLVHLVAGQGSSQGAVGGDIILAVRTTGVTTPPGELRIEGLSTVATATTDAIWNNNGVLNIGAGGSSGGTADALPLAGGTMIGNINFGIDALGQTLGGITTANAPVGTALNGGSLFISTGDGDGGSNNGDIVLSPGTGYTRTDSKIFIQEGGDLVLGNNVKIVSFLHPTNGQGFPVTIAAADSKTHPAGRGGDLRFSAGDATTLGGGITMRSGSGTTGGPILIAVSPSTADGVFGSPLALQAGNATGLNAGGGGLQLYAGNGTGIAGAVSVLGGHSTGGHGGNIEMFGGNTSAPEDKNAGGILLKGGTASGVALGSVGGTITIDGGQGQVGGNVEIRSGFGNSGSPGHILIEGSDNSDSSPNPGGRVGIIGGKGSTGGPVALVGGIGTLTEGGPIFLVGGVSETTNGGDVLLTGGQTQAASGGHSGGSVRLQGGSAVGTDVAGVGGDIIVAGGSGKASSGNVEILGGAGGLSGDVFIAAGNNSDGAASVAGNVSITGGASTATSTMGAGQVDIRGGPAAVAGLAAGNLVLGPGVNTADATKNGKIFLLGLPTAATVDPEAIWNNAGVLNIGAGGSSGGGAGLPTTGGELTGNLTMGVATRLIMESGSSIITPDIAEPGTRSLTLTAGKNTASSGSAVYISGGEGQFGGGGVELKGGAAIPGGDGAGGWIYLEGGAGDPTFSNIRGKIRFGFLPTLGQTTADAIWNNGGVINIGAGGVAAQEALEARLATIETRLTAAGF